MIKKIKAWIAAHPNLVDTLFNFKSFDAAWQFPAGVVVLYFAVYHIEHVIAVYFGVRGVQMAYTGLYDLVTNPVKREAKFWNRVEEKLKDVG